MAAILATRVAADVCKRGHLWNEENTRYFRGSKKRYCAAWTGEFRGLLCRLCNAALGLLKDDPERISNLLSYLQKER
jgi:hypothetical protein